MNTPTHTNPSIEWLGELPTHWKILSGKRLYEQLNRPIRTDDQIVTAFRNGEVTLRANRRTEGFTFATKEHGYQGVRRGDLVIHAMDAFAGAIGVSDSDGKCTPVYSICSSIAEVDNYYYAYLLRHMATSGYIHALSRGIRQRSTDFRFKQFAEVKLPVPPLETQRRIAAFLDRKTAAIDDLIAKKQRLIELLEEKRAALINRVVTKGLNPDAPMKDSGVPWIGDIPAHWSVSKVKHTFRFASGGTPSKQNIAYWQNGSLPWVSPKDMKQDYITTSIDKITPLAVENGAAVLYPPGCVLVVVRGMILAKRIPVALLETHAAINQDMKCLIPKSKISVLFAVHFLSTLNGQKQLITSEAGHGTKTIPSEDLGDALLLLPPLEEQLAVANHIKKNNSSTQQISDGLTLSLRTLTEYRQALITAAVTGQIDVDDDPTSDDPEEMVQQQASLF